jgi:small subunit ribosomal protein S17
MAKTTENTNNTGNKRKLVGVVRQRSGDNTVSVTVERFIKHPVYQKYFRSSKNYPAHDADNAAQVGDKVQIIESKPISKTKRFVVDSIIKPAVEAE